MKLIDKGRFAPRPHLHGPAEKLGSAIEAWPEVQARTHWELGDESVVDGADFYIGDRELGHIHLYDEAHIAVSRALRDALVEARLAEPFPRGPGFVVKRIHDAKDAREAEWIFALAYDRIKGAKAADLIDRVESRRAA